MEQPELGKRLTALRKEKSVTQEELAEKSHVSARTIQRIESGEVLPRVSTAKILWKALGENYESFSQTEPQNMESQRNQTLPVDRNNLLLAALAGTVYLIVQIVLGAMDVAWLAKDEPWSVMTKIAYTSLSVVAVLSYALFLRGFITLGSLFENTLLKSASYMLMFAIAGMAVLDVTSLSVDDMDTLWFPYAIAAVMVGTLNIVFGVALIRLQDSMGELSRIAGFIEIVIGCMLVTVFLFFFTYVLMIPAIIAEILLLYRGYEYLSKPLVRVS